MLHEFGISQLADDLYDYTLEICGRVVDKNEYGEGKKRKKKTYRFPAYLYPNYVDRILQTAGDIHESVIITNESRNYAERISLQTDIMGKCIYLTHLIRTAHEKGWVSDNQSDKWKNLTSSLYWKIYNWQKSDQKRSGN